MAGNKAYGQLQTHNTATAIAYLRVSTSEQDLGLDAQRDAIARWSEHNQIPILDWFTDQGVSGGAPIAKRRALLDAILAVEAHCAPFLVVAKRDRIARDVLASAQIELNLKARGARLLSVTEPVAEPGPDQKFMTHILTAVAEYERHMVSARTRAALRAAKARGVRLGRQKGPTLYITTSYGQSALRMVLSLTDEGFSRQRVADTMAAAGFTRLERRAEDKAIVRTSRPFDLPTVQYILRSAVGNPDWVRAVQDPQAAARLLRNEDELRVVGLAQGLRSARTKVLNNRNDTRMAGTVSKTSVPVRARRQAGRTADGV